MPTIAYLPLTENDPNHEPFECRLKRAPTALLVRIVNCFLAEADLHAERAHTARERWHAILDELDRRRRAGQAA